MCLLLASYLANIWLLNQTDWPAEETESAAQTASGNGTTQHLWEESWDDDDTSDDFSAQLRYVPLHYTDPFFPLRLLMAVLHLPSYRLSPVYRAFVTLHSDSITTPY
jgi:hypothetical protein